MADNTITMCSTSIHNVFDTEGEAAVTMTDSTFSWDAEDSERATLKKLAAAYSLTVACDGV